MEARMNALLGALIGAILILAMMVGGIWAFQTYAVYRFDKTVSLPQDFAIEKARVMSFQSDDGTEIPVWVISPAPGRPMFISFYGNFAGIGSSLKRLRPLIDAGYGIAMMEYRSSGANPGKPSEEAFAKDARALYDQLDTLVGEEIPVERRILHGFSLGSGVAARLGTERAFAAIIFEAALPRLCDYFQRRYFGLPFCRVMWAERFDTMSRIKDIPAPKLFVHGRKDDDVPVEWAETLFAASNEPKAIVILDDGSHSDLPRHGMIPEITAFLTAQGIE
jgi:uncharacterized protein